MSVAVRATPIGRGRPCGYDQPAEERMHDMKFTVQIESDNAAYSGEEGSVHHLIGEHLDEIAAALRDGFNSGTVKDPINGQTVGTWSMEGVE